MSQGPRRLKDSLLEGYLTEGLDAEARAWVESVLAESEVDRARLAELRADSAAFLLKHPPGPLVARYEATQRPWLLWLGPLVAAVVVVRGGEDPLYTAKGSVGVVLYRQRGAQSVRVQPGGELAPGDTVRFEVRAERSGYVAVLGRDGAGQVPVRGARRRPATTRRHRCCPRPLSWMRCGARRWCTRCTRPSPLRSARRWRRSSGGRT